MKLENEHEINCYYDKLVKSVKQASDSAIRKRRFKHFLKPYWCEELTKLKKDTIKWRSLWMERGKPRSYYDDSYIRYKEAKRNFRKVHRKCVASFMQKQDNEINSTAEVDSKRFWRLLNNRRKGINNKLCEQMKFNDVIYRDADVITEQWRNYFNELYTPTESDQFDDEWKNVVNYRMDKYSKQTKLNSKTTSAIVNTDDISCAIKKCKRARCIMKHQYPYF
ncbi:hypothetical protein ACF0H5_020475 [Mactra antiquata]